MNIQFQPDGQGFHYKIMSPNPVSYWISYVAIGVGGHQITGELNGRLNEMQLEGYHRVHFPVIHVGAKEIEFETRRAQKKVDVNANGMEAERITSKRTTDIIESTLVVPDTKSMNSPNSTFAPYRNH